MVNRKEKQQNLNFKRFNKEEGILPKEYPVLIYLLSLTRHQPIS